ncbi:MAG TPA: PadR family transcriptional regulator [candidate division Zixibacteria bacterium]|nr:PadR family transcriptional regulator [candidate division Zixibacteria bacterium]HEQ99010.1 PadR family transcriptional regulator [candidate division Zixibacteria bacterium]
MKLNPTDYIIMAYLKSAPMHVYKLSDKLKEDKVDSWIQYSIPHIYYSLRRLKENGLVSVEIKSVKSKPAQKIYSLTDQALKLLDGLQDDNELISGEQFFPFDLIIGLARRLEISGKQVKAMIENRIAFLKSRLEAVQNDFRAKETGTQDMSKGERLAFQHRIRFLKGEIDFYRKSLKEFK